MHALRCENQVLPIPKPAKVVLPLAAVVIQAATAMAGQESPAGGPTEQNVAGIVEAIDGAIVYIVTLDALDNET